MKLKNKTAIITGAAQGLGRACALRFLQEGANVVLADINAENLVAARTGLAKFGDAVSSMVCDVSKRSDLQALVDHAIETYGQLDIMVNNAGIAKVQDFLEISDDQYDAVMNVNLRGAFVGTQIAGKQMIAQGHGGVIINMSSINALVANPTLSTYAISKGGINQLTNIAAVALAPHKIRVLGIGPGTIMTEMVADVIMTSPEARHNVLSRTPLERCGEPHEIASVAAFLASDDASYMTGQTVYPDGGRMALHYSIPVKDA